MKKIKKIFNLFLLGVMLFNNFYPLVNALEVDNKVYKTISAATDKIEARGNIEVELQLVLPVRNKETSDISFQLYDNANKAYVDLVNLKEITDTNLGYLEKSVKIDSENIRLTATKRDNQGGLLAGIDYNNNIVYVAFNLYGLKKGDYQIQVKGTNFVTYQMPVTLDDFSKRISLTDEAGMFEIGDINQDAKVDLEDANLMLSAIDNNNLTADLNLDGVVNIADLNYITAVINGKNATFKEENTSAIIDNSNLEFEVEEGTIVPNSGSLSSIFSDNGGVTLQASNGKEVNEDNPINLVMNLGKDEDSVIDMSQIRVAVGEHGINKIKAIVEDINGVLKEFSGIVKDNSDFDTFTDLVTDGEIIIDLKGQIAVKKVTLVITETKSDNLADIAKVEFLNNVKMETKEPEGFYIPKNIKVDDSVSEQLTVTFNPVPNVTGYEIKVTGPKMNGVIFQTTYTTFTITDLKNYEIYKIAVQAVYQEWESKFSEEIEASPKANRLPPPVDNVTITPGYSSLDLSWKKMDDTKSYNIYFKEVGSEEYQSVKNQTSTNYSLKGLKESMEYEVYITGNNDLGEGGKSQVVKAKTLKADATIVPKYKIINDDIGAEKTNHIKDVIYKDGRMVNGDKFSIVDNKFQTYWELESWSAGTYYSGIGVPIVVLDKTYKMDEFVLSVPDSYPYQYKSGTYDKNATDKSDTVLHYWNDVDSYTDKNMTTVQGRLTKLKDENNRTYYLLKLEEPINASAVQFGITVAGNGNLVQISEINLYEYDSLVSDVANLFVDDLRVELKKDVTESTINELKKRADIKDHGEYNPYRESILNDLNYALDILNDRALQDVITLNPNVSNSYNGHLGFAMTINDYQPLGISVKPKEKLNVYVGSEGKLNIELVFTQYYAEANKWQTTYRTLNKGLNIVEVPQIGNALAERGGSVYVRYTSTPDATKPIKIRVSGGTKIPVLDTSLLNTEESKKEAIKNYITSLNKHIETLKETYQGNFDPRTSVLGATEIVTKHGLFSVSANAVLDAINSGLQTDEEKINRVYNSCEAFDEMMELFYRQKGLSLNASDSKNEFPKSRINIRYMRMFDGAFMYAGGYHIGIEYSSIAGLIQANSNTKTKTGYFGWGISHEVGHQINQGNLVYAEVTNNVYSLLAQTSNDKDKSRLELSEIYPKIYDKVTSHTIGKAQNVFVQLGMYWQLHLAYDDKLTFEDTNSIYARINQLSRTYDNTLNFSKDDLLILFASKSASKDLTDFFETWGLVASDSLKTYLKDELKLPKETRAIQYLNDEARRYRLAGGTKFGDLTVSAEISKVDNENKQVTLNFDLSNQSEKEKLLGYEILRNNVPIAFLEKDNTTYVDSLGSLNNRTFTYQVVAYDYLLNKVASNPLKEIKIASDGSLSSKDSFTIESNYKAKGEKFDFEDDSMDYDKLSVNNLIDGNKETFFNGVERITNLTMKGDNVSLTTSSDNPYVIINLNDKYSVTGIKYKALVNDSKLDANAIRDYKVYVRRNDTEDWIEVATGKFNLTSEKNYEDLIYFMKEGTTSKNQLWTYNDISYIKIEAVGNKNGISGAEIDVIAPPGDNVDISMLDDGTPTIGVLESDYVFDESLGDKGKILKGSVVLKGEYRGSPSFNILTIASASDSTTIYEGYQLLFANVNDDMSVYEVASGIWFYVMTQEEYEKILAANEAVRANLYRVNDAITKGGQRLTSTSVNISNLPKYNELKSISIVDTGVED